MVAIEKTNRINALFDFYEPLLTEKQMTYIALYYRDDYSLGEIAENFEVSRQAVYDNIKRTEKILEEYEKTGITVDGLVTSQLLINIFEHNTPLHDGVWGAETNIYEAGRSEDIEGDYEEKIAGEILSWPDMINN